MTLELATAGTKTAPAAGTPAAEASAVRPYAVRPSAVEASAAAGASPGRTRDRLSSGSLCEGEQDQLVTMAWWLARIPGDWLSGRALP